MRVKDQVVDGDRAYVLANYDLSLPNGKKVNGDVVEAWTIRDGKLALRTAYHDSYSFDLLMKQ
jgi:ketosteroid isomerase-like protein